MLDTIFNETDVTDIYRNIVLYSILNFGTLDRGYRNLPFSQKRYYHALNLLKKMDMDLYHLKFNSLEEIESNLALYWQLYQEVLENNLACIYANGAFLEKRILMAMQGMEDIEKISFLGELLSSCISYSQTYFDYCLRGPSVFPYVFDFKDNIPVPQSVYGTLVMGQGISDDITNLLIDLGRKSSLNIRKLFVRYHGFLSSLSAFVDHENIYLIDLTRMILKQEKKKESFLVSANTLNRDFEYQFFSPLSSRDYLKPLPDLQKFAEKFLLSLNQEEEGAFMRKLSLK